MFRTRGRFGSIRHLLQEALLFFGDELISVSTARKWTAFVSATSFVTGSHSYSGSTGSDLYKLPSPVGKPTSLYSTAVFE